MLPTCESKPSSGELSPIDDTLLDEIGEEVTVASWPTVKARCTLVGCDCCNWCGGPVMLCGADRECSYGIEVGSCGGSECSSCCTFKLRERVLVARGVLEMTGGNDKPGFFLVDPEYCYVEEGS